MLYRVLRQFQQTVFTDGKNKEKSHYTKNVTKQ